MRLSCAVFRSVPHYITGSLLQHWPINNRLGYVGFYWPECFSYLNLNYLELCCLATRFSDRSLLYWLSNLSSKTLTLIIVNRCQWIIVNRHLWIIVNRRLLIIVNRCLVKKYSICLSILHYFSIRSFDWKCCLLDFLDSNEWQKAPVIIFFVVHILSLRKY